VNDVTFFNDCVMPGLQYEFTFMVIEIIIFVLPAVSSIRISIVNNFENKFYNLIEEEIT
jgi:hypothetical protein